MFEFERRYNVPPRGTIAASSAPGTCHGVHHKPGMFAATAPDVVNAGSNEVLEVLMKLPKALALPLLMVWLAIAAQAPRAFAGPTLLFEAATGRILYAEDQDDQWHPASLTKIMTAYVTFQALKSGKVTLETQLAYSETAHAQPPSKIGLPVGATVSVDLALQAVIVKSANDIAVVLAEGIGGSEAQFVEQMNATARRLGMTRTVFRNPHGLPATEQVTTARDLARLSMAVIRDFPEYAHYWAQTQFQIANIRIVSHNGLFKTMEGADGIKTGFICDSGYNMVASATRQGMRLMAVVLGEMSANDRNVRAQQLLEHGYLTLDWKTLFGARDTVASLAVPATARDAASIRTSVVATECNNRRMARATAVARKRIAARKKTEGAARKAGEKPGTAAAPKTASPKSAAPKAAPKAAAAGAAGPGSALKAAAPRQSAAQQPAKPPAQPPVPAGSAR